MYSHTFDTHEYIKELIKTGLKEPQAEAIVKTFVKSREYDFSKLATREQITVIEHVLATIQKDMEAMRQDIDTIRQDISEDIDTIRQDMAKFATKSDIDALRNEFKNELKAEIAISQNNILKWIIPLFLTNIVAVLGMVITMIKVFGH